MKLKLMAALTAIPFTIAFAACGGSEKKDDPILIPDAGPMIQDGGTLPGPGNDGGQDVPDAGPSQNDAGDEQLPPASIGWCRIVNEPSTVSIENGGTFTAYAQVFAAGRTEGEFRENSGIKGQMGTGAPGTDVTGWTWADADYNRNFGEASGNNYEYMASYSSTQVGTVAYAFRFQVDGGEWFYCDTDGHSADDASAGFSADALGTITVKEVQPEPKPAVEWCRIVNEPASLTADTEGSVTAFAQVYVPGRTEGEFRTDSGVKGQMGTGAVGSDPTSASGWDWKDASYNTGFSGSENHDEYMASFSSASPVTVAYAFRFKVDDSDWFYCDADGHSASNTAEGFSADALGTITIKEKAQPQVDWCRIVNEPASVTIENGGSFTAYAQVYSFGRTEGDYSASSGVKGQMGIGPKDSDPTSASGWNWSDAEYNTNFSGAAAASNYEYMATYTSENAGTVAYAFRFKVDSGDWFYCDTDGHHVTNPNEPFSAEALGTITVKPKPVPHVDWCRIVNEPSSVTIENGGSFTAYAQVYSFGRTEGEYAADHGVVGQMGVGPKDSDPSLTNASGWNWWNAENNPEFDKASSNYEFMADYSSTDAGTVTYAFRFKVENSEWFYCDTDGHHVTNTNEPFSASSLGTITVEEAPEPPPTATVSWCNVQNLTRTVSSLGVHVATSQVYVPELTENGNAGSSRIEAEVGFGTGSNLASWTWKKADINEEADVANLGDHFEYVGEVGPVGGTSAQEVSFTFRYKLDGGPWFYCDADGHSADDGDAGFDADNLGTLSVIPKDSLHIGWCRLHWAGLLEGSDFGAYAYVYVANADDSVVLTGSQNGYLDDAAVEAQIGLVPSSGSETVDVRNYANNAAYWHDAHVNPSPGASSELGANNSEYEAIVSALSSGKYSYAYRLRIQGASEWIYCGNVGVVPGSPNDTFDVKHIGSLIVP